MARCGIWFERILAWFQHCNPGRDLRGSRLSHIDQQRLPTVLGPAYWQNLQCILRGGTTSLLSRSPAHNYVLHEIKGLDNVDNWQ